MSTPSLPPADEATASQAVPREEADAPLVLAIVVSHNGARWVAGALRTLRAQRYPNLRVIGVDSGSTDATGQLLRRLGEDNVVTLERNAGLARGVVAALRSPAAEGAEHLLLVHDDMALMPDAVQWLVDAMRKDPSLAVVGPKLRRWDDEPLLEQVGMSADVFGRAESLLGDNELDQGQHDGRGDMLWVSSAGMLVRRDVFTALGGFDSRFDQFREDLDLCWRVWLSGRRVGVVSEAVGYHLAATATGAPGRLDPAGTRYRVERHTLATLLKNYSARRLAWVLPVGLLINLALGVGLLLSRRFGEAFAILRAYLWNLAQLPDTLQRRSAVQQRRRQGDKAIASLFAPGLPRLQVYTDAFLGTIAGGNTRALVDAEDIASGGIDPLADQPVRRFLRDRPLVLLGIPLLVAFLFSLRGYLGDGPIVGGEISAWPAGASAFLRSYLSPWGGEPLASPSFPSPVQAVLGLLSGLMAWSPWLAERLLVFGLIPLAFLTTMRAGRLVTSRAWPRVIGATVYVISPVVLGTLAEGRYGAAILAALLPSVVALTIRTTDPATPPGVAWRSTALLSLSVLLTLGAAPVEGLMTPAIVLLASIIAILRGWIRPLLRLAVGGLSAVLMLAPWLLDVMRDGGPPGGTLATDGGPPAMVSLPLWRALAGQPQTVDGLGGSVGLLLLAVPAAVLLGSFVVGMRSRPLITGGLVLVAMTSGAAGWAAAYYRVPLVWPPALLLPGAVATAVLAVILVRWSSETLAASDFGVGQVATGVAGMSLVVGILAGLLLLAGGPWTALREDPQLLPAFIGADVAEVGPYRVLLLDRAADGTVRWDVTPAEGPTMVSFGTIRSAELTVLLADTITQAVGGVGNDPGATLGLLNIRYVVLLKPDPELASALIRQRDLEPLPSTAAVTFRVSSWLPRASVLTDAEAARLLATGLPAPADRTGGGALAQVGPAEYRGGPGVPTSGLLVLSESASGAWRAADTQGRLEQVELPHVNAFRVPSSPDGAFRIVAAGGLRRRAVVALQLLLALAVISLALRPPGSREEPAPRELSLPADLAEIADQTTTIPRIQPGVAPPGGPR